MQRNIGGALMQGLAPAGPDADASLGSLSWEELEPLEFPELDFEFEGLLGDPPALRLSTATVRSRGHKRGRLSIIALKTH